MSLLRCGCRLLIGALLPTLLTAQAPARFDSAALAGLRWREIGPYRGGRSVAVAGNPSRPDEFWFGTTGGGVFKSINAGQSWAPMTDRYFGGTIGAVKVAAATREEVIEKLKGEIRYRLELCPCTGETWQHIHVEIVEAR